MVETVEKVGANSDEGADVKKAKGKIEFVIADAVYKDPKGNIVTAVNADGKLIAVPKPIKDENNKVIYAGFNLRKHEPLKKGDFAELGTYVRFSAFVNRVRAAILLKKAEEMETKATRIEQFGDEETRKKVARMARMRQQLEILEKQLSEDGVDITNV